MVKRIIMVAGDPKTSAIAHSGIKRQLLARPLYRVKEEDLHATMLNNVNRMFGLIFGEDAYKDREDVLLPDFFGHSLTEVTADFYALLYKYGGGGVLGRIAARRVRFETQANTFLFHGYDTVKSLIALATEPAIGVPDNMLILWIGKSVELEAHEAFVIKATQQHTIPDSDIELMHLLARAAVARFLGVTELV